MLWSAFLMGFLGSFHCIAMCGPIVLALPGKGILYKGFYNLGRIITYTIIGAFVGLLGKSFAIAGYQQLLSVGVGISMLVIVLFTKYKHFDLPISAPINKLYMFVKKHMGVHFQNKSVFSPFLIGFLNGLLPCGLVYAAVFAALSLGSVVESATYMALFGLGTIPMMLGMGIFSGFITQKVRTRLHKMVPYFLAVVAILLILRGMNLGVPYLSPKIDGSGHIHSH